VQVKIARLYHTIKHLKPSQLAFFVLRRKFPAVLVQLACAPEVASGIVVKAPIAISGIYRADNQFHFLNIKKDLSGENINWSPSDVPRLWCYNLHYFDYLRENERCASNKHSMIESWIDHNPQGSEPGWEPFTASLRIVNWVFYLARGGRSHRNKIIESLYLQALWLEKNDERHILANHYFENLKALLFAGVFFKGDDAKRWRQRAMRDLLVQLEEQTLADGGHYERSPQYHGLMLENYLDIYNLAISNPAYFSGDFVVRFRVVAQQGLEFFNSILFPNRKIPLFNDSAFEIAPSASELNEYARQLFDYRSEAPHSDVQIIEKGDFGLYGVRSASDMLVMDCGEIGPAYQPGHTHCDFLSYELMVGGEHIVVDTGVCEYEPGERRHFVRSTKAHNTVRIDKLEQSEIWGEFRVARRAKKLLGSVESVRSNVVVTGAFEGFFSGWWRSKPRFRHERKMCVKLVKEAFDSIEVVDTIASCASTRVPVLVESFVHFHDSLRLSPLNERSVEVFRLNSVIARIDLPKEVAYRIEPSIYCPEFGLVKNNYCLVMQRKAMLPQELTYTIQLLRS
jgi:uncharacterized heparinase superfamily protein